MIRYALRCPEDHRFEAWFASSDDFDRLQAGGHVTCAICGGGDVRKDMMAPAVAGAPAAEPSPPVAPSAPDLSRPASAAERALQALRRRVEAVAENVGRDFAREARAIHEGAAPDRPIWGEARPADARALIEDGIPVAPLPWPSRKTN